MTRPRGEIREALHGAASSLLQQRGTGGTWRELAELACVGFAAARNTVQNMARAGDLEICGEVAVEGARRPMALYAPVSTEQQQPTSVERVIRSWAEF